MTEKLNQVSSEQDLRSDLFTIIKSVVSKFNFLSSLMLRNPFYSQENNTSQFEKPEP